MMFSKKNQLAEHKTGLQLTEGFLKSYVIADIGVHENLNMS